MSEAPRTGPPAGPPLGLLLAAAAGAAVEIIVSLATGRREAWDSSAYWAIGYPALVLVSALLGALWPVRAWRLGFVAAIAQMLTMLLRSGDGSLWPLGLILGAALGVPCALAADAGRRLRSRARRETP